MQAIGSSGGVSGRCFCWSEGHCGEPCTRGEKGCAPGDPQAGMLALAYEGFKALGLNVAFAKGGLDGVPEGVHFLAGKLHGSV